MDSLPKPGAKLQGRVSKVILGDYLLTYTINDRKQVVWVIGFRHGSRLPRVDELPE